jgi:hypothetical protein
VTPPTIRVRRYLAALAWASWAWPDGPDLSRYCNWMSSMVGGRLRRLALIRQYADGNFLEKGGCLPL